MHCNSKFLLNTVQGQALPGLMTSSLFYVSIHSEIGYLAILYTDNIQNTATCEDRKTLPKNEKYLPGLSYSCFLSPVYFPKIITRMRRVRSMAACFSLVQRCLDFYTPCTRNHPALFVTCNIYCFMIISSLHLLILICYNILQHSNLCRKVIFVLYLQIYLHEALST